MVQVADRDRNTLGWAGNVMALGLLLLFGVGVIWTLAYSLKPPLLADERPPTPICVLTESTTDGPVATEGTTGADPTDEATRPRPSRTPQARPQGDRTTDAPSRKARSTKSTAAVKMKKVSCPGGDLQYPMQTRGAYDPNERFIGLLAVVGPLITTVVGFFFGARAGSSEGRAQAAEARAKTESLTAVATPDILAEARKIAPQAWEK